MALLATGSVPPPLRLAQADGTGFELASALGRDRVLIAFYPSYPSADWLGHINQRQAQLQDYDLQVLALAEAQVLAQAPPSSAWLHIGAAETSAAESYGVRAGEAQAFLVGKDRGVKQIYAGDANLDEILALIDTMPMRRAEKSRA